MHLPQYMNFWMKFSWIDLWVYNMGFIYYTWALSASMKAIPVLHRILSNEKFHNFDTKIQIKIPYVGAQVLP